MNPFHCSTRGIIFFRLPNTMNKLKLQGKVLSRLVLIITFISTDNFFSNWRGTLTSGRNCEVSSINFFVIFKKSCRKYWPVRSTFFKNLAKNGFWLVSLSQRQLEQKRTKISLVREVRGLMNKLLRKHCNLWLQWRKRKKGIHSNWYFNAVCCRYPS